MASLALCASALLPIACGGASTPAGDAAPDDAGPGGDVDVLPHDTSEPPDQADAAPDDAGEPADRADAAPDEVDAPDEEPPSPPGVGLMHTTAQLDFLRAHRDESPWREALQQLMNDAEAALGLPPNPPEILDVPGGYDDPEAHTEAKERLRRDAFAAYALALGYQLADSAAVRRRYGTKAAEFLDAWATVNRQVTGDDGDLVLMYAGVTLLYAADLIMNFDGWPPADRSAFTLWSSTVFWQSSDQIKDRDNNWGAWGTLGAMASAALVENSASVAEETERLRRRIADTINADGELPEENKRTNSGMWYTYFALVSTTAAVQIAFNVSGVDLFAYEAPNGRSLRLALDRDFLYAVHPELWPYPLPPGLEGELWRILYPCADEVELPSVTGWPGPLFEIMSDVYGVPEWREWVVDARPLKGYHAWIYVTLARQTP
jgi:hypothetical protein